MVPKLRCCHTMVITFDFCESIDWFSARQQMNSQYAHEMFQPAVVFVLSVESNSQIGRYGAIVPVSLILKLASLSDPSFLA